MKIVEFIYEKTIKRPKRLRDNNFVIFASERIQVQPGEKANLPNLIMFGCTLLPTFCGNGLKLENCFYISAENNKINLNQPINLPWKLQFELVNRSIKRQKQTRNYQ